MQTYKKNSYFFHLCALFRKKVINSPQTRPRISKTENSNRTAHKPLKRIKKENKKNDGQTVNGR